MTAVFGGFCLPEKGGAFPKAGVLFRENFAEKTVDILEFLW